MLLAIDASSDGCSVALQCEGRVVHKASTEPRTHAQVLLQLIDACMAEAESTPSQLTKVAVVNGPGSFTGVRIAVSVAQGLAYGLNLPVVSVSSLDLLAYSASRFLEQDAIVISALDARMQEIYWSAYAYSAESSSFAIEREASVSTYQALIDANADFTAGSKPVIAVGSAFSLPELSGVALKASVVDAPLEAKMLLSLLADSSFAHLDSSDAANVRSLQPFYLRNQVAWQKRKRIRQTSLT